MGVAGKSILASIVMDAFVQGAVRVVLPAIGAGKLALLLFLFCVALVGTGIYFGMLRLLKVQEIDILFALAKNKLCGRR